MSDPWMLICLKSYTGPPDTHLHLPSEPCNHRDVCVAFAAGTEVGIVGLGAGTKMASAAV